MRKMMLVATCLSATSPGAIAQVAMPDTERVAAVAPALAAFTSDDLFGRVWQRKGLSVRDRSLVTLAALVARGQSQGLPFIVETALANGVTAAEVSETITHLAFYAGWPSAMVGVEAVAPVFAARGVTADALPDAKPAAPLPLDEAAEATRQRTVQSQFGAVSQSVVDDTEALLFRDLWLRPGLAPRDRSLVTVAALIAAGQVEQIPFHLNRAMDNGLSKDEASEMLSHLAFYAGWPNVFSAMPVAKTVFEGRPAR